jgi:hypothetical protein
MQLEGVAGSCRYDAELGTVRPCDDDEADLDVAIGVAAIGSFVRCAFRPERTPVGVSVGPEAVASWAYLDVTYGLGVGPLDSAREVRAATEPIETA